MVCLNYIYNQVSLWFRPTLLFTSIFIYKFQMRNCKGVILQDLETTLSETIPQPEHQGVQELPSLSIDGIPTSVEKMTQVHKATI